MLYLLNPRPRLVWILGMNESDASDPVFPPGSPDAKHRTAEILPTIYRELRKLAAQKMANESPGQTINATALVHEAYLQLEKTADGVRWDNRGHFYMAAAEAMRRILIDRARSKNTLRRGGQWERTDLDHVDAPIAEPEPSDELLALDEALHELDLLDERKGRLVKLRYFVGLGSQEAADLLGISKATADRDWAFARAWLHSKVRKTKK